MYMYVYNGPVQCTFYITVQNSDTVCHYYTCKYYTIILATSDKDRNTKNLRKLAKKNLFEAINMT
jgi:hypothetical protein